MSSGEIIVIVLVFLMLFGTKNLPSIARGLGKGMNEFRKATEDFKKEINVNTNEITNIRDKIKKEIDENVNYQEDIKKGNAINPQTYSIKKPSYPNIPENANKTDLQNIDYSI